MTEAKFEAKMQVDKSHYNHLTYDHKARWLSYWYQLRLVLESKPKKVLEIGLGNGLITEYLRKQGVEVSTLDIDVTLHPDLVGSITKIPLPDASVDCVLAAEVLEHIPFNEVETALKEMRRVSCGAAVISVPDSRRTLLYFGLKLPLIPRIKVFLKVPLLEEHKFDGQHYWEMGKKGYDYKKIEKVIKASGFRIQKHFVPFDCPTKHFFVLKKLPVAS